VSRHYYATLAFLLVARITTASPADPAATAPADAPPAAPTDSPPWITKPHDSWPLMVLKNTVQLPRRLPWNLGCGFLLKLPTGKIVAVTGSDSFIQHINFQDFKNSVTRWTMSPPDYPDLGLDMAELAVDPTKTRATDCLAFTVAADGNWPSQVLTPSLKPVQVGQTVFLIALQDENGKISQTVIEGTVEGPDRHMAGMFGYLVHAHIPAENFNSEFQGSPVLDVDGHVVAIQQSYFPEVTHGDHIMAAAFQLPLVLDTINLPPEPQQTPATDVPATEPADQTSADAQRALGLAKAYIAAQSYDIARAKLQAIITNYPGTPAAAEAQTDLDQIQDK
jgi:hypothetical protein